MNHFMYTTLRDRTNTRTLNWADFLLFLLAQLSREKTTFFPYDWLHPATK
jgi:hypothetical protein